MNGNLVTPGLYLMIGLAVVCLFKKRRETVGRLDRSDLPEFSEQEFHDFKILMKTAYERTLYLGVIFFPLAFSAYHGTEKVSTVFFLLLIGLLFLSNIPPRHKIMHLLRKKDISARELSQRGIRI